MYKKISEIKVKDNVRKDMGDLKELTQSIKEEGVLEPLVIDKNNNLIFGHRRFAASKAAGLKEVPVIVSDSSSDRETLQLIENMQRKDLTPFEEAQAFQLFIKRAGYSGEKAIEHISSQICKTMDYIKRRLAILKLSQECTHALNEGRIEIGHAQILAQMGPKQQEEALKEILEWDLTVQNFADQFRWMTKVDFGDIKFRGEEKEQKTLLDTIGVEMSPEKDIDSNIMDNPAFKKEVAEYVEKERKKLKDKAILVFNSVDDLMTKHKTAREVYGHNPNYNKIIKSLPGSKAYGVVVDLAYHGVDKDVYELAPKEEKVKEKEESGSDEESEKMLEKNRDQKLANRIEVYSRNLQLKQLGELTTAEEHIQRMTVWHIINSLDYQDRDEVFKELKVKEKNYSKQLMEAIKEIPKSQLSNQIRHLLTRHYVKLSENDLKSATDMVGLDLKKHWEMDEDFLNCHTKDKLKELAAELKIDTDADKTKELHDDIMKGWKKGSVPKALQGKGKK